MARFCCSAGAGGTGEGSAPTKMRIELMSASRPGSFAPWPSNRHRDGTRPKECMSVSGADACK
eukprot:1886294-Pyramimonas_sp.AAC.1